MSLSDRVKDVLQGPESDQQSADYRPPGSFPTDDMAPTEDNISAPNTHQRNKLHKSNDPRGRGHGHTDSGVGLMDSSNEPAATKEPVEDAYGPAEGYEARREHAERSNVAEFDDVKADTHDTTEYEVNPKDLGATAGTTTGAAAINTSTKKDDDSTTHNTVRSGTQRSNVEHKDPYWGDIPQGQGVYNTVSGHGSNSDDARRTQTTDEAGDHRAFPLVTDRTRQHHDDPTEKRVTEEHREPERATQKKDDSHWKEGAAGAAVAGAAGTAAYKATRNDDDDRAKDNKTEESPTDKEKEKKKSGGLFGVFHRGRKDDKDKDKRLEKEEKERAKQQKEFEKEHSKDEKSASAFAAGYHPREHKDKDEESQKKKNTDSKRSADPAAVAAAATAMHHGDSRTTTSDRRNDPSARGNDDGYDHLGSGTASGIRPSDTGATSTRDPVDSAETRAQKDSNRNAALYGTAGTAAALGAGGYAAHELRKDRDDKQDPLARDNTNTREETSRSGGGWFTSPKTNTQTTESTQPERNLRAEQDPSQCTATNFVAAPVPAGMSTRDPAADNYPSAIAAGNSQPTMREPTSEMPRTTDDANHHKYNTLSSGTPSGINVSGDDTPKASATSSLPTVQDEKSNRGAMATAGIAAAGAGAGAAYYATRDDGKKKEEKEDEKKDQPLQRDSRTTTTVLPGAVGGQQKVTHKCVKCGEENDISQYFKDKVGRNN